MVVNNESALRGYTVFNRTGFVATNDPIFEKLTNDTPLEAEELFKWENGIVDFEDLFSSPTIDADKLAWYCNNTKTITMMKRCAGKFARLVELKRGCPKSGKNKRQTWASVIKNKLQREIDDREKGLKSTDQRTIEAILLHATGLENKPDQVCSNCARDTGPFEGCVIDSDFSGAYMAGCSNCRYQNHGSACTRNSGRKKERRPEERDEQPDRVNEPGDDDSKSTLKPDSPRRKSKSSFPPTLIEDPTSLSSGANRNTVDLALRPTQNSQPPTFPMHNSGKSGQVQAAASIAALNSMSPTSKKVYADIMVKEMSEMGLMNSPKEANIKKEQR